MGRRVKTIRRWKKRAGDVDDITYVYDKARPFAPHAFNSRIGEGQMPVVYFTPQALNDMWLLVDEVSDEVGWLGSVKRVPGGFLVMDAFLTTQKVTSVTTELDEAGISELTMQLLSQPDGMERANSLRFWGHSHVDMEVYPSGQDDNQMEEFAKGGSDFFIRAIFNKLGRIRCDIYYYNVGLMLADVPWALVTVQDETRRRELKEQIKKKVTKEIVTYKYSGYGGGYLPYEGRGNAAIAMHDITHRAVDPLWDADDNEGDGIGASAGVGASSPALVDEEFDNPRVRTDFVKGKKVGRPRVRV